MDENNIILLLWSKISNLIDEKTSKLKFDKTFKATIWEINTDGTYQINYKGQIYSVPNALDTAAFTIAGCATYMGVAVPAIATANNNGMIFFFT